MGLFTTGQKAGFDVDVNFGILMGDDNSLSGTSYYNLSENLCKKIGLEAGYGNVGFGYGLEVGPRSAAVSLTMGRVYFSTQFTYNRFFFRSRDAFNAHHEDLPEYLTDLDYRGIFHDWMLKGLLVYRF